MTAPGGMHHRFHRGTLRGILLAALAWGSVVGCASPQLQTRSVEEARAVYTAADATPAIFDHAASSMRQAQHHLRLAEQLLEENAPQDEVDHHGFLARQHVAIAEARLERGLAQDAIERGEQHRRTLMLEARKHQAAAAAERAEAVEDELADTQMQLRMAERRAKALAERLLELGVTSSRESDHPD